MMRFTTRSPASESLPNLFFRQITAWRRRRCVKLFVGGIPATVMVVHCCYPASGKERCSSTLPLEVSWEESAQVSTDLGELQCGRESLVTWWKVASDVAASR